MTRVAFFDSLTEPGNQILFTASTQEAWDEVLADAAYIPWMYAWYTKEYLRLHLETSHRRTVDLSCLILSDGKPIGLWSNYLFESNGAWLTGYVEATVLPPLFRKNVSTVMKRAVARRLQGAIGAALRSTHVSSWRSVEGFASQPGLSEWHQTLAAAGAQTTVRHQIFTDLRQTEAELRAARRKSYKSMVNAGLKLWKWELHDKSTSFEVWDQFRLLYEEVAGRVTQAKEAWAFQHEAIRHGEAFAIFLRDTSERLVGGALFCLTATEAYYAMGAYDRTLFDKPLGHVVQHCAIEEMQRRGLRWYRLGARPFAQDDPPPSPKDLSIAFFKEGFGTHLMPEFVTTVDTAPAGQDKEAETHAPV